MATKEELSQDKRLINVSNLVHYTSEFKTYLDDQFSKKQDKLVNGGNIAKLAINGDKFDLIGNSSEIDLTDSIVKTISKNFLEIPNSNNTIDFTRAIINFNTVSDAFKNGIKQYIGISWKKYNSTLKVSTPVYFYFTGIEKDEQTSKFYFVSFDGIYTIIIGDTFNGITRKSF